MSLFSGLSAFPITPANQNGSVDVKSLQNLLNRLVTAKVDSIGLLGSTGTYAFLSIEERKRALEAAIEIVGGKIPLIVGIGAIGTSDAAELAKHAKDAGADGLLLAPVSYTPLVDEEVYQHFNTIAAASDLPLCIYNNPGTTKFSFSYALIERLAKIDNIAAIKMPLTSEGDFKWEIGVLREVVPDDFIIGYSGDWGCKDALLAGADSWFSVAGGILPELTMELSRAALAGDEEEANQLNESFAALWSLFQEFGSLRVVYAIAHELSLTDAELPRPLLPLRDVDRDRVKAALKELPSLN